MRELGRHAGGRAAQHADLLHCLPGNVLLVPGALDLAARSWPTCHIRSSGRGERGAGHNAGLVVIPLLKRLDREGVTRRLAISGGA